MKYEQVDEGLNVFNEKSLLVVLDVFKSNFKEFKLIFLEAFFLNILVENFFLFFKVWLFIVMLLFVLIFIFISFNGLLFLSVIEKSLKSDDKYGLFILTSVSIVC